MESVACCVHDLCDQHRDDHPSKHKHLYSFYAMLDQLRSCIDVIEIFCVYSGKHWLVAPRRRDVRVGGSIRGGQFQHFTNVSRY